MDPIGFEQEWYGKYGTVEGPKGPFKNPWLQVFARNGSPWNLRRFSDVNMGGMNLAKFWSNYSDRKHDLTWKVAKEGNFGTQDSTFLSEFPHIKDPVNLHKSQTFFLQKHRLHSASVRIFRLWRFSSKMWPCSSLSWRWTREIEDPGGSGRILWSHSIINSCFLVTLIGGIGDIQSPDWQGLYHLYNTTYSPFQLGDEKCNRESHLLWEPGFTPFTGWWFIWFTSTWFSPWNLGKMIQFDEHIFFTNPPVSAVKFVTLNQENQSFKRAEILMGWVYNNSMGQFLFNGLWLPGYTVYLFDFLQLCQMNMNKESL